MKKDINQLEADRLDNMRNELTEEAQELIATTELGMLHDMFGGMSAEEINRFAVEW